MTKKQNRIMTGLILWAGLLIVVLYSPIGSPDLYHSTQNYYSENRNVAVNTSVIHNAPKANRASDNSTNDLDIPQVSFLSKTNYSVGNYQSSNTSFKGSSYSVQTQTYQTNNLSGSGGMNGGGSSFIASGGSRNSAGSSGIVMTNGITSLSLTTDLNNSTSKQSVTNNINGITGGTDPGDDPTGNPIPLGDGWKLLVLFGVCYTVFKMRFIILKRLQFHSFKSK